MKSLVPMVTRIRLRPMPSLASNRRVMSCARAAGARQAMLKHDDASREEPIPVIVWNVIASSMMSGQAAGGVFKRAGLRGCHARWTGQGESADERSCDVTAHARGGGGEMDAAAMTLHGKRVRCLNCWIFVVRRIPKMGNVMWCGRGGGIVQGKQDAHSCRDAGIHQTNPAWKHGTWQLGYAPSF